MLVVNTTEFFSRRIYMKIGSGSQKREMPPTWPPLKSRANQQLLAEHCEEGIGGGDWVKV